MCCIVKCCNCHAHSIGCGYGWCGMAGIGLCVCVGVCVCVEAGKMAKDIGMTIRKGIVVPFLPCLVAFGDSIPICSFIFFNVFLLLVSVVFLWGGERYEWCLDGLVVWGR